MSKLRTIIQQLKKKLEKKMIIFSKLKEYNLNFGLKLTINHAYGIFMIMHSLKHNTSFEQMQLN